MLAVDVGTSRVKASVLTLRGELMEHSERPSPEPTVSGAMSEVDAESAWNTLVEAVRGVPALLRKDLAAVGVTAQLGVCLLDSDLRLLDAAVTWQDRRAATQAKELEDEGHAFVAATGRPIVAERMASILRWYAHHEPSVFQRISLALPLKDYLNLRLTGRAVTDVVHAAYTCLYDLRTRDWSREFLQATGVTGTQVPLAFLATEKCGEVTSEAAERLGIVAGTPVVVSAPDGTAAAVGAGANSPGVGCDMGGTSEVVFIHGLENAIHPTRGVVVNPHPLGNGVLAGGPMASMGSALEWVAERLAVPVSKLGELSEGSPPGARGLMFFPTFDGSRAPDWDDTDRGGLIGLTSTHAHADIARAALEGVAFHLRRMVQACRSAGADVTTLLAVGAAARDEHLTQIKADVLGTPISVRTELLEAGTRGVLQFCKAMLGVSVQEDADMPAGVQFEPDASSHLVYERVFEDYWELQLALRAHFHHVAPA